MSPWKRQAISGVWIGARPLFDLAHALQMETIRGNPGAPCSGLGEETGWRGFLLPALERRWPPLASTLALAVAWAAWHWPLFLINDTFRDFGPGTLIGFFLGLACGAVVLTFVYHRTRNSVLMAAIWHVLYNLSSATAGAKGVAATVSTTGVMMWAFVLVVLEVRAARRGRSVLRPGLAGHAGPQ